MTDLNCKNCGAPLDGSGTCPYCGTVYEKLEKKYANRPMGIDCTTLGDNRRHYLPMPSEDPVILKMGPGEEIPVTIESVEVETSGINDFSRTPNGKLSRGSAVRYFRITCVATV